MTAAALIDACHQFADITAPYLHITDEQHYQEALELVEQLLEDAADTESDPLNAIIGILSNAIEAYETKDESVTAFVKSAEQQPGGLSVLRLLMDQHGLGMGDLPEIGSKSMVSRVLSGERNLNMKHIAALANRFGISPVLFF